MVKQSVTSVLSYAVLAAIAGDKPLPTPSFIFGRNRFRGEVYVSGIFEGMGQWCLEHGISMQVKCLQGFHKIRGQGLPAHKHG